MSKQVSNRMLLTPNAINFAHLLRQFFFKHRSLMAQNAFRFTFTTERAFLSVFNDEITTVAVEKFKVI